MPGPASVVRLSKLLSLMLRHRPQEFDLEVDGQGFADLDRVVSALQKKDDSICVSDVEGIVDGTEKKRFEIVEGKIRARYGHSFRVDLGLDPAEPPEALYKGVHPRELEATLASGLKPFDRQYVHLSYEADVAAQLGRGGNAVVKIDATSAHAAGVEFFDCGPTMLTELVPSDFLTLEREAPDRSERDDRPSRQGRPSRPDRSERRPSAAQSISSEDHKPAQEAEAPKFGRKRTFRRR